MHPDKYMTRIVNRKKYSVATATLLASDEFWDGSNWERYGRNQFLYRTPGGEFFTVHLTQWQGERDTLEPITQEAAIELFESLPEHAVEFAEAFPDVPVIEA
jgi:hypothetical protein